MNPFDYIPWQVWAGGGLVTVVGIAGVTYWFTRSWKLAALAAITVGIPALLKAVSKRGYDHGREAHEAEVRKENLKIVKEGKAIDAKSNARTPAERRKRVGRFVRND